MIFVGRRRKGHLWARDLWCRSQEAFPHTILRILIRRLLRFQAASTVSSRNFTAKYVKRKEVTEVRCWLDWTSANTTSMISWMTSWKWFDFYQYPSTDHNIIIVTQHGQAHNHHSSAPLNPLHLNISWVYPQTEHSYLHCSHFHLRCSYFNTQPIKV